MTHKYLLLVEVISTNLKIDKIIESTNNFTQAEIMALIEKLESTLFNKVDFKEFMKKVMEQKFADGLVCPHCKGNSIKKNGFTRKGRTVDFR